MAISRVCQSLAENDTQRFLNLTAKINKEKCQDENKYYYCPIAGECRDRRHGMDRRCDLDTQLNTIDSSFWLSRGCAERGQKWCFYKLNDKTCIDKEENCTIRHLNCTSERDELGWPRIPRVFPTSNTKNMTPADFLAGRGGKVCRGNSRFLHSLEQCPRFSEFQLGNADDNGTGWRAICEKVSCGCPKVSLLVEMCAANDQQFAECFEYKTPTCAEGRYYCQRINKCIPGNTTCGNQSHCRSDQYRCHSNNQCLQLREPCPSVLANCPGADSCYGLQKEGGWTCAMASYVCKSLADNNTYLFREYLKQIDREKGCDTKPGTRYCVMTGQCQFPNMTCDEHVNNPAYEEDSFTPWGENCSSTSERFCVNAATKCIPKTSKCTFSNLTRWIDAGNKTVRPDGTPCPGGQMFCPLKWDCIHSNETCVSPVINGSHITENKPPLSYVFHPYKFCKSTMRPICKNETCEGYPKYDLSMANDEGTGWKVICKIRSIACPRIVTSLERCAVRNRNYTKCARYRDPTCSTGYKLCKCANKCVPHYSTCEEGGDKSDCPKDHHRCPSDQQCRPYGQPCPSPSTANLTTEQDDYCTTSRCGTFVNHSFSICRTVQNVFHSILTLKNMSRAKEFVEKLNKEMGCSSESPYCPYTSSCNDICQPGMQLIQYMLDAVNKRPVKPWGEPCPVDTKFCIGQMFHQNCTPINATCDLGEMLDYLNNADKSLRPDNTSCPNRDKFCYLTMKCTKSFACQFSPALTDNMDAEESICPYGYRFCNSTLECQRVDAQNCPTLVSPKDCRSVSDSGAKWLKPYKEFCQVHGILCPQSKQIAKICAVKDSRFASCLKKKLPQCPQGEDYCVFEEMCIPGSRHNTDEWRMKCNSCPEGQIWCRGRGCISNNETCVCTSSVCGKVLEFGGPACKKASHICRMLVERHEQVIELGRNLDEQHNCPSHKPYCQLMYGCHGGRCDKDTQMPTVDEAALPWGEACPFPNDTTCFDSVRCVSNKTCTMNTLMNWLKQSDRNAMPFKKRNCASNEKFCFTSQDCIPREKHCECQPINFTSPDGTNTTAQEWFAGSDRRFCWSTWRTRRRSEDCPPKPALNYDNVTGNTRGWLEFCKAWGHICPRFYCTLMKCIAEKPGFAECVGDISRQCPEGYTYCETRSKCLPHSQMDNCDCKDQSIYDSEYQKCIPWSAGCGPVNVPGVEKLRTLWPFNKLKDIGITGFIAITGIESLLEGTLVFRNSTSGWRKVGTITVNKALILSSSSAVKFMPNECTAHGAVKVHYLQLDSARPVGRTDDVSALTAAKRRSFLQIIPVRGDCFPFVRLKRGAKYEIEEDSKMQHNAFNFSDKLHYREPRYLFTNRIPASLRPYVENRTMEIYCNFLKMFRKWRPALVVVNIANNPDDGDWYEKLAYDWRTTAWRPLNANKMSINPKTPSVVNVTMVVGFKPAEDFYGKISAWFAGGITWELGDYDTSGWKEALLSCDLPSSVHQVLEIWRHEGKGFSQEAMNQFLREFEEKYPDQRPSLSNLNEFLESLNKTDKTDIRDALRNAIFLDGGNDLKLLKHRCFKVEENGQWRVLKIGNDEVELPAYVIPVNDPPAITGRNYRHVLPFTIRYANDSYNGFTFEELIQQNVIKITDVDGDGDRDLWLVIEKACLSRLGQYEYFNSTAGQWTPIDIGCSNAEGKVLILAFSTTRIWFKIRNHDVFWNLEDAFSLTKLVYKVADSTLDPKLRGVVKTTGLPQGRPSPLSKTFGAIYTLRKGCNNIIGSMVTKKRCLCSNETKCASECSDKCVGCDNVTNSGAKLRFGVCVGGTTNISIDSIRQCGGAYRRNYFEDACGYCLKTPYTNCNGTCEPRKYTNKCGPCVLTANNPIDKCGVCNGNGSSCTDCEGTPNGSKVLDVCGNCLLRTNPQFGRSCVKLGKIWPNSVRVSGVRRARLMFAGFSDPSKCVWRTSDQDTPREVDNFRLNPQDSTYGRYLTFDIKSCPLSPGYIEVGCVFPGSNSTNFTSWSLYKVRCYDDSGAYFSDIVPHKVQANTGPWKFAVRGIGFPNNDGYVNLITDLYSGTCTYINSSYAQCRIPNSKKAGQYSVCPSFGEDVYKFSQCTMGKALVIVYKWSPQPTDIYFITLSIVVMVMDDVAFRDGSSNCNVIFASGSCFGNHSTCLFRGTNKAIIVLGSDSTCSPGMTVIFLHGSVRAGNYDEKRTGTKALNISTRLRPDEKPEIINIVAPRKIGRCASLQLCARLKGCGTRGCTCYWSAAWAASQNVSQIDSKATYDLQDVNSFLATINGPCFSLPDNLLRPGFSVEFSLVAENFLNANSSKATVTVKRLSSSAPMVFFANRAVTIYPNKAHFLRAIINLSPCLDVSPGVNYLWSISPTGSRDVSSDRAISLIPSHTLLPQIYIFTVKVTMNEDPSQTAEDKITVTVISSPLFARIVGGYKRSIARNHTLELEGICSDPDRPTSESPDEDMEYIWECFDAEDRPLATSNKTDNTRLIDVGFESKSRLTFRNISSELGMEAGSEYQCQLRCSKGHRVSESRQQVISVSSCELPYLWIENLEETSKASDQIVIAALKSFNTSAYWESAVDESEYESVDLGYPGTILAPYICKPGSLGCYLVLAPFALQFTDKRKFKMRLIVTEGSCINTAETVINVNMAPTAGRFSVSPSTGQEMRSNFTLAISGWSDDSGDFRCVFGIIERSTIGETYRNLGEYTQADQITTILPAGDPDDNYKLTLFVRCKDDQGAATRRRITVVVERSVINETVVVESLTVIKNAVKADNMDTFMARASSLVIVLVKSNMDGNSVSAEAHKYTYELLVSEVKKEVIKQCIKNLGEVEMDNEDKINQYNLCGGALLLKSEPLEMLITLVKRIIQLELGASYKSRRRRRAVSSTASSPICYTAEEAQSTLLVVSNFLNTSKYDTNTTAIKKDFLQLVFSTGEKVSACLVTGMAPVLVKNKLVGMRVEKTSLENASQPFNMACNDCPNILRRSANVTLGEAVKTAYQSWNCSGGRNLCPGVALITIQLTEDLLSRAPDNTSLTNVVGLQVLNPSTYADITDTITTPLIFRLPLKTNVTLGNNTHFTCKRWTGSSWESSGCVTNTTVIHNNGTDFIECVCTERGYLAVFITPAPPTTQPPTTTSTTTATTSTTTATTSTSTATPTTTTQETTTSSSAVEKWNIRVVFLGELGDIRNKTLFAVTLKETVAGILNIDIERIVNISITPGSIVVIFSILPSAGGTEGNMEALVARLEDRIKQGLTINLPNGETYKADPESFSSARGSEMPTAKPPPKKPDSGLGQTEYIIIGCVIGGLLLLAAIVVGVYLCKKKEKDRSVSPPHDVPVGWAEYEMISNPSVGRMSPNAYENKAVTASSESIRTKGTRSAGSISIPSLKTPNEDDGNYEDQKL